MRISGSISAVYGDSRGWYYQLKHVPNKLVKSVKLLCDNLTKPLKGTINFSAGLAEVEGVFLEKILSDGKLRGVVISHVSQVASESCKITDKTAALPPFPKLILALRLLVLVVSLPCISEIPPENLKKTNRARNYGMPLLAQLEPHLFEVVQEQAE